MRSIDVVDVERALSRLFIDAEGTRLRREDRKKAVEVAALLSEIAARAGMKGTLVDAAAGKAYVGLLAVELCGARDVRVIERDPRRAEMCRAAARRMMEDEKGSAGELAAAGSQAAGESTQAARESRISRGAVRGSMRIDVRTGDVGDGSLWPEAPHAVVALHACGSASDMVLDAAVRARARWLFLVPCCYGADVPFAGRAGALGEALGVPRHAEVRRRFAMSLIDAERTLRLEAAGYETTVVPFVAPTVTGHNLLWRARWSGEAGRMREAGERLAKLRVG